MKTLNEIIVSLTNTFQERERNYTGLSEDLQDILVLTFAAGLVPTPGSVGLTCSYNRALNFVSSITSKRYRMRVSCRES